MTAAVVDIVDRLLERGAVLPEEFTGPCPAWCRSERDADGGDGPHERLWNAPHGYVMLSQRPTDGTLRLAVVDELDAPGSRIRLYTLDEAEGLRDALTVAIDAAGYIGRHSAETRRRR